MRRFLISSKNFTGQVELIYDERDQIVTVDLINASLTQQQTEMFIRVIPSRVDKLGEALGRYPQLTIVEGSFEVTFSAFWTKYNLKVNKIRAEKEWNKLLPGEHAPAYYGILKYDKYVKERRIGKAHPETYLRNKYWENEY